MRSVLAILPRADTSTGICTTPTISAPDAIAAKLGNTEGCLTGTD